MNKADARVHRYSRGYLPHLDSLVLLQFITFRLADSLPANFVQDLERKLSKRLIDEREYHAAINKFLDLGKGPIYLKQAEIAQMVAETLLRFDGVKYELWNWVLMPNHAHILLKVMEPHLLSEVMHSIKGYTAVTANRMLYRRGRFWAPDYFDRYIRDRQHLAHVMNYIDQNPVKAGLCDTPETWPWGRAGWKGPKADG